MTGLNSVHDLLTTSKALVADNSRLSFMEVCGTHTMAIARMGLRSLLTPQIRLISGPGCPVCVTSEGDIARILDAAERNDVIIATFGDMIRVPAGGKSLQDAKANGAEVRVVFSPMDALELAVENPKKEIVFPAIGFETTAPTIAATILTGQSRGIKNFSVLPMMKTVIPALQLLCEQKALSIDGFILPGHVSAIIGERPYRFISEDYAIPCAIAGFGDMEIARAILSLSKMAVSKTPRLENLYRKVVSEEGNTTAMSLMERVFKPSCALWRGIGELPDSGLVLRDEFEEFDTGFKLGIPQLELPEDPSCRCGEVILGKIEPSECPHFGRHCTPSDPLGACMVSSEGSCAAYYKYRSR